MSCSHNCCDSRQSAWKPACALTSTHPAEAAEAEEDTEQTGALGELEREQSLGGTSDAAEIRDDEEDEDAVADVQTKLAAPFRGGA